MSDFKERLICEKSNLEGRIERLNDFLGSEKALKVGEFQLGMLKIQSSAMATYLSCLIVRIKDLID